MDQVSSHALETKSTATPELADAFEDFMRAFEAFKETNDERLVQIERRSTADAVTGDKLARINADLDAHKRIVDELALKSARPALGGYAHRHAGAGLLHKAAFEGYVRTGEAGQLRALEAKALSGTSDPDGGYLVPPEIERTINRALRDISPIRGLAGIRQVSGSVYKKPISLSGPATGWVTETAARPQTGTPTLSELSFPTMELYAMPAATSSLLDDSIVDIESWIAEEVRVVFAEQEGSAFVGGDGVNKPKGLMTYPKVAQSAWAWGSTGYVATGVAGSLPASGASDKLIDLIHTLKAGYRANATFVMNRATLAEIRKLKDAEGDYLWMPAGKPGEPSTLMNFPLAEAEDMPGIAADAFAIAFGDFQRGYLIVDRSGIRILRDPYSSKPYVLFYTTKRVGGGMQDFNAIKLLKFGVS